MTNEFKSESRFSFLEATSIIVGHGVGAGILSVPYIASRNTWWDFIWIVALAYTINLLMHLMIAELSFNNGGAQFITCLENELFRGKMKKGLSWVAFGLLALSEVVKVGGFIAGAGAVFTSWFGLPDWASMLLYYMIAGAVVFAGMKIVGICEKISVYVMVVVIGLLLVSTLLSETSGLPCDFFSLKNELALYSMVTFSLSAVMSVPQVVKGLDGNVRKIRGAIALGTATNLFLILMITFMTVIGAGKNISNNGALVDLAEHLGGWVAIAGYLFTLLALSTSLWACTLNLRDVVHEKLSLGVRKSWVITSVPCLLIALFGASSFVGLTRLSSAIQVVTGLTIILCYNHSRKRIQQEVPIRPEKGLGIGRRLLPSAFSGIPFQVLVVLFSLIATVGSLVTID